ncbi:MAG: exonuclease domain-containing protein, partial [Candidatus Rokuibacteriota bacterium]
AVALLGLAACLGAVAGALGRSLRRRLRELRLGTELMATVNPGHRLRVDGDGELAALAEEVNRLADRLHQARGGLEEEVTRATRELEVERGKLSAVLDALGEGVAVATPDGRITLANRAAHELLRATWGGLLGRSLFDFVDREKVAHFLERLGRADDAVERFSLHPAGDAVLETVMTPLFGDDLRMIGFVLVLHDVTHPARSDEQRRRLLAETVYALRGPLASVRSLSESLLDDPAFARAPARRLLEGIHGEAVRLSALVREMGEPARPGLGGAPRHFESVTVADLVAMALRRLRQEEDAAPEGPQALLEVEVDGDIGSLPPLAADVSALRGALRHLLRVVAARRDPGGRLWLRPWPRGRVLQFDVGAQARAAWADLEALLDVPLPVGPWRRATVREIVHRHAGEVWAYGAEGRAGFRVTVPLPDPGESAPAGARDRRSRVPGFAGAGAVAGPCGAVPVERPDFFDFSLFEEMARHVLPDDREQPLENLRYVVLDLETTGLRPDDGDRVVSIAGVPVRGGAVKRGEAFDALVNPRRSIPASSVRFHGITDGMVADAPPLDVVLPAFLRFAEGAVLIGHQVWFDVRFLGIEAARLGLPPLTLAHPVLDTLVLSEIVHGLLAGHGLDEVAGRLGVVVHGRHSALGDAVATADVFVRLLPLLRRRGIVTLGQALDAARTSRGLHQDDITPAAP